jgi:YegS/Rv2252/BmrU family lipid kinase
VRLLIIRNPVAGKRGQRLYRVVTATLEAAGCRLTIRRTEGAGDAARFAAEVDDGQYDRLVVAGGDGTVNEVVNGLAAVARPPPLALIPIGTANVLAAEIGLRARAASVLRTLRHGEARPIALGAVDGRRFVLMAGVGFDAHVVAGVDAILKRRLGKGAYVWSFLLRMVDFRWPRYRLAIDGRACEAASVVIANARRYAGPFVLAPEAGLERPELQICRLPRAGPLRAVRYAVALIAGRLWTQPGIAIEPGRRITIDGPAGEPVHADGDVVATLPATITVIPNALRLVFPPANRR